MSMKSSVFCDITPCSPVEADRRFGGAYGLNLHGRTVRQERNHEATSKHSSSETSLDLYRTTRRCIPEDISSYSSCRRSVVHCHLQGLISSRHC
jgi:hypothetical protein